MCLGMFHERFNLQLFRGEELAPEASMPPRAGDELTGHIFPRHHPARKPPFFARRCQMARALFCPQ